MAEEQVYSGEFETFSEEPPIVSQPVDNWEPFVENETPGILKNVWNRASGRFLGSDVEDPLALERLGPTVAGSLAFGVVGAGVGSAIAPGPGTVVGGLGGGVLGAFVGARAPEGALEAGEFFGVLDPGTRDRLGLSANDLNELALNEAVLEAATGGTLMGLRAGRRGFGILVTGSGTKIARETAEAAARQGVDLMPVQVGKNKLARGYVNVFGRFPFIGDKFVSRGTAAEGQLQKTLGEVPERIAPLVGEHGLSREIYDNAIGFFRETSADFSTRYQELWQFADDTGVLVFPKVLTHTGEDILKRVAADRPIDAITGLPLPPGPATGVLREFIETNILPMKPVAGASRGQKVRAIDLLIEDMDDVLETLEPKQQKFIMSMVNELREAAKLDVYSNAIGANADQFVDSLRALDDDFSKTMETVFETATANRFASVRKRGIGAREFDPNTKKNISRLADIMVDLKSPESIDELFELIPADTQKLVASTYLDKAIQASQRITPDGSQFIVQDFVKRIGWANKNGPVWRSTLKMLEKAGGEVTEEVIDDIVKSSSAIASLEIPNMSSFIARRASIGGLQSLINGVVPGLALAATSRNVSRAGGDTLISKAMGAGFFILGGKFFTNTLSDPRAARAFAQVADKELTTVLRNKAVLTWLSRNLELSLSENKATPREKSQMRQGLEMFWGALETEIRVMIPAQKE